VLQRQRIRKAEKKLVSSRMYPLSVPNLNCSQANIKLIVICIRFSDFLISSFLIKNLNNNYLDRHVDIDKLKGLLKMLMLKIISENKVTSSAHCLAAFSASCRSIGTPFALLASISLQ